MKPTTINYQVPIIESMRVDGEFLVKGVAISATTTSNNHKFLSEELQSSAKTLIGVPLLVDHENRVDAIKGRVLKASFDNINENIPFEAKIMDKAIQEMVDDGRINTFWG